MADFFSHVFWSYVFFHSFSNWPVFAFFGVLPDLLFGIPALVVMARLRRRGGQSLWRLPHEEASRLPGVAWIKRVYWSGHSIVLILALSLAGLVFVPALFLPVFFGMLLHFALDVLTHENSLSGQKPFYPLSNYKVKGLLHWRDRRFLAVNYGLLALAFILMALGFF